MKKTIIVILVLFFIYSLFYKTEIGKIEEKQKISDKVVIVDKENSYYPKYALDNEREGNVVIEGIIDELGRIISANIVKSSDEIFNENSLALFYNIKFERPIQRIKGKDVDMKLKIEFVYRMN